MIITTLIVALGLAIGAWVATARGYRLSGVVVVSLLTVYTLIEIAAFPVFILSTALAYVVIVLVEKRLLLYGRRLLLAAIVVGAVMPVALFVLVNLATKQSGWAVEMDFLGSILPGIAAYNFYRVDADRRLTELVASFALFAALLAVGMLSLVLWSNPPSLSTALFGRSAARYVSPLLLTAGSDIAGLLEVPTVPAEPSIGSLDAVMAVIILGLVLTEFARARWGLRPAGVIALPLVALFALRVRWIVPVYLIVIVATYAGIKTLHDRTLVYGRALLSVGIIVGVLVATGLFLVFGLTDGLAMFFGGLLGGVGAYNFHVVAPRERVANAVVSAGGFVLLFAVARLLITPLPTGLVTSVSWFHVLGGALVLAATVRVLFGLERLQPTNREIHEASPFRQEGEL